MLELAGRAPAKINLVLEVLGRRPDGFHEIETVLQVLDLADRVTIRIGGEPGMFVTGPAADGAPADETNLAWRGAEELARRAGQDLSRVAITIHKVVPVAGGLGGGSSDAATVIRLLSHAWRSATTADVLASAAATGSDVPFFLTGGTARAQGRGERITPVAPLGQHGVVLFILPATLESKTARLFTTLAATPFDSGARVRGFLEAHPREISVGDTFNAFERVAFEQFSGLGELRDALQEATGAPVRLSGAGPTLFWIGPLDDASEIGSRARGLPCTVIPAATWHPSV